MDMAERERKVVGAKVVLYGVGGVPPYTQVVVVDAITTDYTVYPFMTALMEDDGVGLVIESVLEGLPGEGILDDSIVDGVVTMTEIADEDLL